MQNSYSALLSSSHKTEEVIESCFSPKKSDKIRLNSTSSQHRMSTVQDTSGICRKPREKNVERTVIQTSKIKGTTQNQNKPHLHREGRRGHKEFTHDCQGNKGKH